MPTTAELQTLLEFPVEKLTVECKSWLRLDENRGRATLAKVAIALANEGGGVIVLGMREDNAPGGAWDLKLDRTTLGGTARTTSTPLLTVTRTRNSIVNVRLQTT
ncbi:MAG: RNA-binding domain-containing protein, partial [Candidatus Sulfotelmatobacter sp.]